MTISTEQELEALYGDASPASLTKEIDYINDEYAVFIEKSPFVVIASTGPEGLDCSPRGDPAGFVAIRDRKTVLMPDRRGNNRLDTLRNIVRDPRVSLLFLIPGVRETLRINGQATISVDPSLLERFAMGSKPARSVIQVNVERVYFQCAKALIRSKLWDAATQIDRRDVPTAGQILQAISNKEIDGNAFDANYPDRIKQTLYEALLCLRHRAQTAPLR